MPVVTETAHNLLYTVSNTNEGAKLKLRIRDVDLQEKVFTILDTKFHKDRLVPFSDVVADSLKRYLEKVPPQFPDSLLFSSPSLRSKDGKYGDTWLHRQFRQLLRYANIIWRTIYQKSYIQP